VRTYTYDAANRLTAVSGSPASSFGYDGLGNRTSMTVSGATTRYALDVAGGLPEVIAATGGATTQYLQVQGQVLAQYDSGTWGYVAPDALGSVRQVVDPVGSVTLAQSYDPFGNMLEVAGSAESAFGYTGEQVDAGTGLVHLRARYYQSIVGRFTSQDPFSGYADRPQTLNAYSYVRNNPLLYVDPTGNFLQCNSDGTCYDDGHSVSNPGFISYDADERRSELLRYNNLLYEWARKGWTTDLAAFGELCDYAASMIPKDLQGDRTATFVYDVASVVTELVGDKYYSKASPLGQAGFDWVFQDPGTGGVQPHHFWAYVTYVFQSSSRTVATAGNLAHETFLAAGTLKFRPLVGRSYQDFALGQEGVNLGVALKNGGVTIEGVGNYVRGNLGPGGAAVKTWNGTINAGYNKKFYALCLAMAALVWPIPPGEQGGGPKP
jgi:RHS repeat-associated protein